MITLTTTLFVTLLSTTNAYASDKSTLSLSGFIGTSGETEADELECKKGCTGSRELDDEDLEAMKGVAFTYGIQMSPNFFVGPRIGYMMGETEDTEQKLTIYDIGGEAKLVFPNQNVNYFVSGGGGISVLQSEMERDKVFLGSDLDGDMTFSGRGIQYFGGIGVEYPMSNKMKLVAGLQFNQHNIREADGDTDLPIVGSSEQEKYEIEFSDIKAKKYLLTVGVQF